MQCVGGFKNSSRLSLFLKLFLQIIYLQDLVDTDYGVCASVYMDVAVSGVECIPEGAGAEDCRVTGRSRRMPQQSRVLGGESSQAAARKPCSLRLKGDARFFFFNDVSRE